MNTVQLPADAAAFLIIQAINDVHGSLDDEEAFRGCCQICCGPCSALKTLLDEGSLDRLVAEHAGNYVWWVDGVVDRDLFARAWIRTECHEDPADITEGGVRSS